MSTSPHVAPPHDRQRQLPAAIAAAALLLWRGLADSAVASGETTLARRRAGHLEAPWVASLGGDGRMTADVAVSVTDRVPLVPIAVPSVMPALPLRSATPIVEGTRRWRYRASFSSRLPSLAVGFAGTMPNRPPTAAARATHASVSKWLATAARPQLGSRGRGDRSGAL